MQIYRRERDLLQTRVTEIEQRSAYHDDHLRVLELWWDQVSTFESEKYDLRFTNNF
jgi:E3 ubiquitin-protein ligase BRE1